MPQPPFKADQFEVAPSITGSRILSANSLTGALEVTDPLMGTLALAALSGLQTIPSFRIVSPSGVGATHTSIQAALDSIPVTAGDAAPYVVFICSGVYYEDVSIVKSVTLVGLGQVMLFSALDATPDAVGNQSTVRVIEGPSSTPNRVRLENLWIGNSHTGKAALLVEGGGGSEVASLGVTADRCVFRASAAGGNFGVRALSCGSVTVTRCQHTASSLAASDWFTEVANVWIDGYQTPSLTVSYDSGGTLSSTTPTYYQISNLGVGVIAPATSPQIVLSVSGFPEPVVVERVRTGSFYVGGDAEMWIADVVGQAGFVLEDSVQVTLSRFSFAAVTSFNTASLNRISDHGEVSFVASSSESVTFDVPRIDNNYRIYLTLQGGASSNEEVPFVHSRTQTGFVVEFSTNQTIEVSWDLRSEV